MNASSLASSHAHTPDPRQAHPPIGQKLIIKWFVSQPLLEQHPELILHLIYKNYTEERLIYPLESNRGYYTYSLLNDAFIKRGGLLTYEVYISVEGSICKHWKHHLFVELIHLDKERRVAHS